MCHHYTSPPHERRKLGFGNFLCSLFHWTRRTEFVQQFFSLFIYITTFAHLFYLTQPISSANFVISLDFFVVSSFHLRTELFNFSLFKKNLIQLSMQPFNRRSLTLIFLGVISTNQGGGRRFFDGASSFVGALPLNNSPCPNKDVTNHAQLNTSFSWCPAVTQSKDGPNKPKCLSKDGQKCPEATILGFIVSTNNATEKNIPQGTDCNIYFLNTDPIFNINSSLCLPTGTVVVHLAFKSQLNDSTCTLNFQEYNYTDQDCEVINVLKQNENVTVSHFPLCTQIVYNCESEQRLIKEFGLKGDRKLKDVNKKRANSYYGIGQRAPPLPLVAHSKSNELRRVERAEGIRRVKKPIFWNWRDHVLEISIAGIVAAVLILIGLKRCLAGKLRSMSSHSRVVRFDLDELAEKRRFSCVTIPEQRRMSHIDFNKNPSKPILKNNNSKQRSNKSHSSHRVLGKTPPITKSFDSNSSIYYDAMEGPAPPEGEVASSQPLISEF